MSVDLLKGLNVEQKKAVLHTEGPLLILAGAGSGKTKTLTHRLANIVFSKKISPYNILAVTFTNKAAGEMRRRVAGLLGQDGPDLDRSLPWIGTFHSICVKILRRHIEKLGYKSSFVIYDAGDQQTLIKRIMKELGIDSKQYAPQAIRSHISRAKNDLVTAADYQQTAHISHFTSIVADVFMQYEKTKRANQALDFDDLIQLTVQLLMKEKAVREEYKEKFKYIFIDEYQDTNLAQYQLVNLLANQNANICVVGDDAQSIYSWRGATLRNILEFERDFPRAQVIKLERNYRSTKNILAAANAIIAKNKAQKKKKLWTSNAVGAKIGVYEALNEQDEGRFMIQKIEELRQKQELDYRDCAILYRTNAQSRSIEELFLRYNIPYRVIGGVKFYERKEIKDVLAYLKVITNPAETISLLRIINVPARGISKGTLEKVAAIAKEYSLNLWETIVQLASKEGNGVRELAENHLNTRAVKALEKFYEIIAGLQLDLAKMNSTEFLLKTVKVSGYEDSLKDGTVEGETQLENISELATVMKKYDIYSADEGLRLFLEEIALITDIDNYNQNENAVTLMTLHSAKGLEFEVVFIPGMEETIFPHARSTEDQAEMAEERRLCYVGFTRAKQYLFLLHASLRRIFGNVFTNLPSRFIDDVPLDLVDREKAGGTIQKREERKEKREKIVLDEPAGDFASGDKVSHPTFGIGRIIQVQGGILKVAFEGKGVKSLAASIAPLKKVHDS